MPREDRLTSLRRSQAQESRVAKKTGGRKNAGSGNGWIRKNDVRTEKILWEMKRTDGKSISLKASDLHGVFVNAWQDDRVPAMHLEIGEQRVVVFFEDFAMELLEEAGYV